MGHPSSMFKPPDHQIISKPSPPHQSTFINKPSLLKLNPVTIMHDSRILGYIPKGETGSINDYALRTIDDPQQVLLEIIDKPQTCISVVSTIENYIGPNEALSFAKRIIEYRGEFKRFDSPDIINR